MYTHEQWKEVKKALSLTNKSIAEIIGTTEDNVKKQLGPSKKLPTWARAMMFAHERLIVIPPGEIKRGVNDDYLLLKKGGDIEVVTKHPNCGCFVDASQIFRRDKTCKVAKDDHTFTISR